MGILLVEEKMWYDLLYLYIRIVLKSINFGYLNNHIWKQSLKKNISLWKD